MLGAHAAFVGSNPTEVEIFIWIISLLWSKNTSVAATDARNIIILHRKIVYENSWIKLITTSRMEDSIQDQKVSPFYAKIL